MVILMRVLLVKKLMGNNDGRAIDEEEVVDANESDSEDDPMWAGHVETEESESEDDSFIVQSDEDQDEVEAEIDEDEIGQQRRRSDYDYSE